ncbi:MAG: VWA domain-containing protein [Reichenbachiella sp.]
MISKLGIVLVILLAYTGMVSAQSTGDNLEIVFVMDASGSVGSSGWEIEEDFVIEILDNAAIADSEVGVVQFSSVISTEWNLYDVQDKSVIKTVVDGMVFTAGRTYTLTAMEETLNVFQGSVNTDPNRVVVLITDGTPYPIAEDPCAATSRAQNLRAQLAVFEVKTVIIGVGTNWNPAMLSCLVEDPATDIIEASSFNELDISIFDFDKFLPDEDGDGIPDERELNEDTDLDGILNYMDVDDDGDGIPTIDENLNADSTAEDDDSDSDGIPNYLDNDDDGDGILTIDEDTNGDGDYLNDDFDGDGVPDYLDTDQNNIAPFASAGDDQMVLHSITFDGSASYDGDGTITQYSWAVTELAGGTLVAEVSGINAVVTGLTQGYYSVVLTVTDDFGANAVDELNVVAFGFAYSEADHDQIVADKDAIIANLNQQIAALEASNALCDAEVVSLEGQVATLVAENLALIAELNQAIADLATANTTIAAQDVQITDLAAQLAATQAALAQSELEKAAALADAAAKQVTIDALNATVAQLEADLAASQTEVADLTAQLATTEAALAQSELEKAAALADAAAKQVTIDALNATVAQLEIDLAASQADVVALTTEVASLEATIAQLTAEKAAVEAELAVAQAALVAAEATLVIVAEGLAEIQYQVALPPGQRTIRVVFEGEQGAEINAILQSLLPKKGKGHGHDKHDHKHDDKKHGHDKHDHKKHDHKK